MSAVSLRLSGRPHASGFQVESPGASDGLRCVRGVAGAIDAARYFPGRNLIFFGFMSDQKLFMSAIDSGMAIFFSSSSVTLYFAAT